MPNPAPYLSDEKLREIAYSSLIDLVSDEGINASGKDEIYGCIFGRDSAITILTILSAIQSERVKNAIDIYQLIQICRKTLLTLVNLQGRVNNIESGEQPGKFIHEFRKDKYEHLLGLTPSWYVYPDGILRNFDSLDSTPLALLAIYRFYEQTKDGEFLMKALPAVERGLNWILTYGDLDKDALVEYELPKERTHGGLRVQSWTDSHESLLRDDGTMPEYPIAPVEVQGYTWLALKVWADFYSREYVSGRGKNNRFARLLLSQAEKMKKQFNKSFLYSDVSGRMFPAQALDGDKNQIRTVTGNSLLLLWATYTKDGKKETILDEKYMDDLVTRSFMTDMFDHTAGIRTMSMLSKTFNPNQDSYHNGSFWPKLNSMCYEGLRLWGYNDHATMLRKASIHALSYFQSPIELYIKEKNGTYSEFKAPSGQVSCRVQAWSAAAMLSLSA